MNILRHMTVFAAAPLLAAPVSAHHSDAGIDLESMVAIEGTVKEFAWRNPHIYLIVESVQSAEYRLRIVEEADRCTQPGALRSCPPETPGASQSRLDQSADRAKNLAVYSQNHGQRCLNVVDRFR